jgi:hypothetical protein
MRSQRSSSSGTPNPPLSRDGSLGDVGAGGEGLGMDLPHVGPRTADSLRGLTKRTLSLLQTLQQMLKNTQPRRIRLHLENPVGLRTYNSSLSVARFDSSGVFNFRHGPYLRPDP